MEDICDWDDFPCLRVAFAKGFHQVSALGVTVEGPVTRRDPDGDEYTPNCIPFDMMISPFGSPLDLGAYTRESKRWKDLNEKPGLLEEVPWTRAEIKEFLKKREEEE